MRTGSDRESEPVEIRRGVRFLLSIRSVAHLCPRVNAEIVDAGGARNGLVAWTCGE
jgi:hypothetical protein